MRYGTERSHMTVNYADVLRQAVENERFLVLREVYAVLDNEPLSYSGYADVNTDNASLEFRGRVKRKIEMLEGNR